ncbi:MAG TPA: MBL fold metallo-hydrolase [Chitinophagaceae bacterium]|nr:MBL fold metallo-hydrolase [Chitinophagaceae bacterium]
MQLFTIDTGFFKLDGGAMYGVVPKSIWNSLNPADENNLCTWALRCLLVQEGDKLILIDTGNGDKQGEKFFRHYYLQDTVALDAALAKHGFTTDDVTDVILTHLHFDHCGGAVVKKGEQLVPAFKNARYWSNERHWKWATAPNEREKASFLKENILPIQESGQLHFVPVPPGESVMTPFASGIIEALSFLLVSGHTEAMLIPVIRYGDKTIVYMADLLPSVGHLPLPYVMAYDMFPLTTLSEKKLFLTQALEKDWILFFEHDPKNECCNLQMTPKGIRHKDLFRLADLQ